MKILIVVAVIALCMISIEAQLKINLCPNTKRQAKITSIQIDDCQEFPCSIKRGRNSSITVQFQALRRINGLKPNIFGIIDKKEVGFPVDSKNHCAQTIKEGKCPLLKNKLYTYQFSLPVLEQYPQMRLSIKYEAVDPKEKSIFCFIWPASIQ